MVDWGIRGAAMSPWTREVELTSVSPLSLGDLWRPRFFVFYFVVSQQDIGLSWVEGVEWWREDLY